MSTGKDVEGKGSHCKLLEGMAISIVEHRMEIPQKTKKLPYVPPGPLFYIYKKIKSVCLGISTTHNSHSQYMDTT